MKTRITRRLIVGALALVPALMASTAHAQSPTVLKLGWTTSDGATDPYAVGAHEFKALVEEKTGGQVEVQLFPNRQLGDEKPMVDGMRLGTVDGGIITNAVLAQVEPSFQLIDLPFLFENEEQASQVLDGPVGETLTANLEAKGITVLGFMEGGFRQMINNVRPVEAPADVEGVKYRVMQNPVFIGMFSSLGGNAVPMSWGETYTAVQQGAIDGLEIPLAVIDQNKYFEVTRYLSLTNHTYSAIPLVVSTRFLDRLPEDQQTAVREAATEATALQREKTRAHTADLVAGLENAGMTVNRVADFAPFREAVTSVYEDFRPSIGSDLLDQTLAGVQ